LSKIDKSHRIEPVMNVFTGLKRHILNELYRIE